LARAARGRGPLFRFFVSDGNEIDFEYQQGIRRNESARLWRRRCEGFAFCSRLHALQDPLRLLITRWKAFSFSMFLAARCGRRVAKIRRSFTAIPQGIDSSRSWLQALW